MDDALAQQSQLESSEEQPATYTSGVGAILFFILQVLYKM